MFRDQRELTVITVLNEPLYKHVLLSSRQTILVKLNTHMYDSELMYNPGDHVGIYASNRKDIVDAILARLDFDKDPDALYNIETLREKTTVLGMSSTISLLQ